MSNIERIDNYVFDERFYRITNDDLTEEYRPSLTHILSCAYPKDFGLEQWRGDVGNKRADEIMEETAEDGSFVHQSIEKIISGYHISRKDIENRFSPKRALKVMRCIKAFLDWYEEYKPKTISTEYIVWHDKFAGTVDYKCEINGEIYIVDFKTSKTLHTSHKVQVCGYGMADTEHKIQKVALLHLGNTTKKKYSFNVLDDEERAKYENECKQTLIMFHTLNPNAKPNEETFPEDFSLSI